MTRVNVERITDVTDGRPFDWYLVLGLCSFRVRSIHEE